MIIGNGVLAKACKNIDDDKFLYFASGVSNSLETRESEFLRELELLKNQKAIIGDKTIFYFSTLSIYDPTKEDSMYVIHKKNMESYIKQNFKNHIIFRIGNAVGKGGNSKTLFNFLNEKIFNNEQIDLHAKATRYIVDVDDISGFIVFIKSKIENFQNEIINLSYPVAFPVREILEVVEGKSGRKANFLETNEGATYQVGFHSLVSDYFEKEKPKEYLLTLANKYL